jgi:hypothetical protein
MYPFSDQDFPSKVLQLENRFGYRVAKSSPSSASLSISSCPGHRQVAYPSCPRSLFMFGCVPATLAMFCRQRWSPVHLGSISPWLLGWGNLHVILVQTENTVFYYKELRKISVVRAKLYGDQNI